MSEAKQPTTTTTKLGECDRLQRALMDCHKRMGPGRAREAGCRHLNRGLAECLVSVACPDEWEAVRSLCGSGGTGLKRSQCQQAQVSLSVCLSSHQHQHQLDSNALMDPNVRITNCSSDCIRYKIGLSNHMAVRNLLESVHRLNITDDGLESPRDFTNNPPCKLLHWRGTGATVAEGVVVSKNPAAMVQGQVLGPDCWKVYVTRVVENA